jgi:hypothetical protein
MSRKFFLNATWSAFVSVAAKSIYSAILMNSLSVGTIAAGGIEDRERARIARLTYRWAEAG